MQVNTRFIIISRLLLLPLAFLSVIGVCQGAEPDSVLRKIDTYLTHQATQNEFRGSVLVGIHGSIRFEKGYGFADEEWNALNSPKTKFRIFSVSKQFTGACVLLLQERGLLSTHNLASKYVDGLPAAWRSITIHQLLTHTSGIPNYVDVSQKAKDLDRLGATPREMINLVADKPLEFTPGTQLRYTNTGYILLGMIIERVSGQSYAQFLQKNIFEPLGMLDSGYDDQRTILKNRASGYSIQNGHVVNADYGDMSIPYAAGGIYSTVEDMLRWSQALTERSKLLSARSLEQMFAVYPETTAYGEQNYGYGVVIARRFGRLLYYHGGGWYGFSSVMQLYPKDDVFIVVLSNLDKGNDAADRIAADLFDEPMPATK